MTKEEYAIRKAETLDAMERIEERIYRLSQEVMRVAKDIDLAETAVLTSPRR